MSTRGEWDVLVVGAGPTGLALAASLAQQNVRCRVIDRAAGPSARSKAIGVQAGTLEALAACFGGSLVDAMLQAGAEARDAYFHIGQRPGIHLDLGLVPSRYNFVLVLAQSETERLLAAVMAHGGCEVDWRRELVSLAQDESKVTARLRDAAGNVEEVTARYVVGCDGAHSVVRRELKIPFAGASYRGDFILGDVVLRWPWPYDTVRLCLSERGFLGCFPMRGVEGFYRLILVSDADRSATTPEISPLEFREIVAGRSPVPIEILKYDWLTRFNLHHRAAKRFRVGRVFLAGDAAHIHSPVGGQGMNTGIQDALNLAHKLAGVLGDRLPPDALARYESDRIPVARRVLRRTDRAFRAVLASRPTRWRRLAWWLAGHATASRWTQRKLARVMSQVDVARREIADRGEPAPETP
jgi:3-(3-hydroxy-phenyl)propionate hydroxylase